MEPGIELLLTKNGGIEELLFGWHRATIHQANRNPMQNVEALPKLPFRKEFNRLLRRSSDITYFWSATFITLTSHTGGSHTPSC